MSELPALEALDLELENEWLTVWFNEPARRNPLSRERVADLLELANALENRRDIRGVVFRGRGGVFCAGGDLKAFQAAFAGGEVRDQVVELSVEGARVFDAIDRLPQFTVAVVEGAAMAGGFGMACCTDFVIAEKQARFSLTETRIGIVAAQILPFVMRRLGERVARRLLLTASSLKGPEAMSVGLADVCVEDDVGIDGKLRDLREAIRKVAPGALAATKLLIAEMKTLPRNEQVKLAANTFADCLLSDEGKEGVTSFMQKRSPRWAEVENV